MTKLLQNSNENFDKGPEKLEAMRTQQSLDALKNVVASRRKPDLQLGKQPVKVAETGRTGHRDEEQDATRKLLKFDGAIDDDEVLVRLFAELDEDESGAVEMTALLRSVGDGMIFSARELCSY